MAKEKVKDRSLEEVRAIMAKYDDPKVLMESTEKLADRWAWKIIKMEHGDA